MSSTRAGTCRLDNCSTGGVPNREQVSKVEFVSGQLSAVSGGEFAGCDVATASRRDIPHNPLPPVRGDFGAGGVPFREQVRGNPECGMW